MITICGILLTDITGLYFLLSSGLFNHSMHFMVTMVMQVVIFRSMETICKLYIHGDLSQLHTFLC